MQRVYEMAQWLELGLVDRLLQFIAGHRASLGSIPTWEWWEWILSEPSDQCMHGYITDVKPLDYININRLSSDNPTLLFARQQIIWINYNSHWLMKLMPFYSDINSWYFLVFYFCYFSFHAMLMFCWTDGGDKLTKKLCSSSRLSLDTYHSQDVIGAKSRQKLFHQDIDVNVSISSTPCSSRVDLERRDVLIRQITVDSLISANSHCPPAAACHELSSTTCHESHDNIALVGVNNRRLKINSYNEDRYRRQQTEF